MRSRRTSRPSRTSRFPGPSIRSSLQVVRTLSDLRVRLQDEASIVLVPTMGNLHAGHVSLVDLARVRGGCVVASIFVNRLQFAPGGDFDRYPRTLDRDLDMLDRA